MRTLSANAITKVQTDLATEPVVVIEVNWGGEFSSDYYADKSIQGVTSDVDGRGRILELSGLDEVILVSGGGQSQQINVTLSDADGRIKGIMSRLDVHKKTVRVWQWFEGLAFSERFLIFTGLINSPVEWNEGNRRVSFSVINRIEDVEVGFSAEEGDFPVLPDDLVGKPWPLVFGQCQNVPALKAVPAIHGTLAGGVGIKDFTFPRRIALATAITCPQTPAGFRCIMFFGGGGRCDIVFQSDGACIQARCVEIERLTAQYAQEIKYEYRQITIFGGKNFPQGKQITLNINGGKFTGSFGGTPASPSDVFTIVSRVHPRNDGTNRLKEDDLVKQIKTKCEGQGVKDQDSDYTPSVFGPLWTGTRSSRISWEAYRKEQAAGFFWAQGGSSVTMDGNNEIVYIANILPSTILAVKAYRTINGNRFLVTVPSEYFTIRQTNYGGYQVMEIVMEQPLSTRGQDTGGGWEDDVYVTLISSVGPNTVDILKWFIQTYTSYQIDNASFDYVRGLLVNYPMRFPLLTRKNLLTVLQEIAEQARCAVWLRGNTFFIRYLSLEPSPVATIGEDDILRNEENLDRSLRLELTKTEDLVTKYTATWQDDHALTKPKTLILRRNVKIYGTHERRDDYYAYDHIDLVRKSLTYWLIRRSTTWTRVKFSTSLEFLNLEAQDPITLNLPDLADSTVIGIVEKATYDSDRKEIDFEVWTPVAAGTRVAHNFAWPAGISENALFPTIEERNAGLAGSGTEPNFSTVAPPNHPLNTDLVGNIITSIGLKCNGDAQPIGKHDGGSKECRQDHGDKKPSDEGDEAPEPKGTADDSGDIHTGTSPVTNGAGNGYFGTGQQLKDQGNQNENNGFKARQEADRGNNESGANDGNGDNLKDKLDSLPDPNDLDKKEFPCQISVATSYFNRKASGLGVCVPDGPDISETYVFNSCAMARAFVAQMVSESNCTNKKPCATPCKTATFDKNCKCEPPEGQDPGIIGYSGTPGAAPIMSL